MTIDALLILKNIFTDSKVTKFLGYGVFSFFLSFFIVIGNMHDHHRQYVVYGVDYHLIDIMCVLNCDCCRYERGVAV